MGRKIEIDISELLDVYIGGMYGDMRDYLFAFLRDDCSVIYDDVKQLAVKYATLDGYGVEDVEDILSLGCVFKKENSE